MKFLFLLSVVALTFFAAQTASAQPFTNGSFETGDFTGWQVTMGANPGSPLVVSGGPTLLNGQVSNLPMPFDGNFQALIQSTGGASAGQGIEVIGAGGLDEFVGTVLPNSSIVGGIPTNGEAIKQTFSVTGSTTLTFAYAYQSKQDVNSGVDETGYVLNGVFHVLADSNSPGVSTANSAGGVFANGLPYQTLQINLAPGTNTISFVAYNTFHELATTALFVDGFTLTPNPNFLGDIPGLTPNQRSVANYVDTYSGTVVTGNFPTLVAGLTALANTSGLGGALDEISPQSLQIFRSIAFDNATFATLQVTNHLANLRDGLTGFDGSQLTVTDPSLARGASQIKNHLLDPKEIMDTKEMQPAVAVTPADRWSTFISGEVVLADWSHDMDLAHQSYTTGSVMLGADYRIDDHFTVGALLDFAHSDATLDHIGSTATVDTYSTGIYGSYVDGGWYGNALFTYGHNSYTEDRNIAIGAINGTNSAAPEGNQYTGSLTGGYEFQRGIWKFGPIAGVQYVNLGINSFSEQGPTALNVQSESDESFRSQLGFEARYATRVGSIWLTPHASVTWQHEFLDGNHGITSQLQDVGSGSFTVNTTATENDSAVIDIGLNAAVTDDVTLFTDYQSEEGQGHFSAQSIQAGVKIGF
jgi:uncharacterized protein with beta-barrel porin domain